MPDIIKLRGRASISLAVAVLMFTLGSACNSSTAPTPTPTPAPAPTSAPAPAPGFTRYHVSGVVTDEAGSPIAAARVEVDYAPPPGRLGAYVLTDANGGGYYEVDFEADRPLGTMGLPPNTVGLISSWKDGYEVDNQLVPGGTVTIVKNLRLRPALTASAGQSIMVSIEPDSSICTDREDWFIPSRRCRSFSVLVGAAGTLTVEPRATGGGGIVPIVFSATSGRYERQILGPGTVSLLQVRSGERYLIFVGIPDGTAPGQFEVTTSLRAAS